MIVTLKPGSVTPAQFEPMRSLVEQLAAIDILASIVFEDGDAEKIAAGKRAILVRGAPDPGEVLFVPNRAERRAKR